MRNSKNRMNIIVLSYCKYVVVFSCFLKCFCIVFYTSNKITKSKLEMTDSQQVLRRAYFDIEASSSCIPLEYQLPTEIAQLPLKVIPMPSVGKELEVKHFLSSAFHFQFLFYVFSGFLNTQTKIRIFLQPNRQLIQ